MDRTKSSPDSPGVPYGGASLEDLDERRAKEREERALRESLEKAKHAVAAQAAEAARAEQERTAFDERLETKLRETRENVRSQMEREERISRERWETHRDSAAGMEFMLDRQERAFRLFHGRSDDRGVLERYEKLLNQLRVAASLFRRDVEAQEGQPTFAVLETLDVEAQEIGRLMDDIRRINPHAPVWHDEDWRTLAGRQAAEVRVRVLTEKYGCSPEEVAFGPEELADSTRVYVGPLGPGLLQKLRRVEHVLVPDERGKAEEVMRLSVPVGSRNSWSAFVDAFAEHGVGLEGPYDKKWIEDFGLDGRKQDGRTVDFVVLSDAQLSGREHFWLEHVAKSAKRLGLRFCTPMEGLELGLRFAQEHGAGMPFDIPCKIGRSEWAGMIQRDDKSKAFACVIWSMSGIMRWFKGRYALILPPEQS